MKHSKFVCLRQKVGCAFDIFNKLVLPTDGWSLTVTFSTIFVWGINRKSYINQLVGTVYSNSSKICPSMIIMSIWWYFN